MAAGVCGSSSRKTARSDRKIPATPSENSEHVDIPACAFLLGELRLVVFESLQRPVCTCLMPGGWLGAGFVVSSPPVYPMSARCSATLPPPRDRPDIALAAAAWQADGLQAWYRLWGSGLAVEILGLQCGVASEGGSTWSVGPLDNPHHPHQTMQLDYSIARTRSSESSHAAAPSRELCQAVSSCRYWLWSYENSI